MARSRHLAAAVLGAVAIMCVIAAASAYADEAPTTSSVASQVMEGTALEPGDAPMPIALDAPVVPSETTWWTQNAQVLEFLSLAAVLVVVIVLLMWRRPRGRAAVVSKDDAAGTPRREGS